MASKKNASTLRTCSTETENRTCKATSVSHRLHYNFSHCRITRSISVTSVSGSDDSGEILSGHSSPEPAINPVNPHDISQIQFLHYFGLATHEVYKEMQNRRVERKRRSTANPQFLYGSRGWDFTVVSLL